MDQKEFMQMLRGQSICLGELIEKQDKHEIIANRQKFHDYFTQPPRLEKTTEDDMLYFKNLVTDDYIWDKIKQFKKNYTNSPKPGVELKPVLSLDEIIKALDVARKYLNQLPNIARLQVPITSDVQESEQFKIFTPEDKKCQYTTSTRKLVVVGDTHGTIESLETIFKAAGLPSSSNIFLFNGDYVDRGSYSVEVFILLVQIMLSRPGCVTLLRGNHEVASINANYSLKAELFYKYGSKVKDLFIKFNSCFEQLQIAARIDDAVFVCHGGINDNFDESVIQLLNRKREPVSHLSSFVHGFDPLSDLLWADPDELDEVRFNEARAVSVQFGYNCVARFLHLVECKLLLRSHTAVEDGYCFHHNGQTLTLFSVANYVDSNKGAFLQLFSGKQDQVVGYLNQFTSSANAQIDNQLFCDFSFLSDIKELTLSQLRDAFRVPDFVKTFIAFLLGQMIEFQISPSIEVPQFVRYIGGKTEIPKLLRHPKVFEELIMKLTERSIKLELPVTAVVGCFAHRYQSDMITPMEMDRTLKELGLEITENLFWEEFQKQDVDEILSSEFKALKKLEKKRAKKEKMLKIKEKKSDKKKAQ